VTDLIILTRWHLLYDEPGAEIQQMMLELSIPWIHFSCKS